jgi:hypothetical protein
VEPVARDPQHPAAPPPQDGDTRTHSGLAITAFVIALVGFLLGWFPGAGFLGVVGVILGILGIQGAGRKKGLGVAAIVLGSCSTIAAVSCIIIIKTSSFHSCPRVYSFDGERYQLDADPLAGALFPGGETTDVDRLEHLAATGGEYRLRVVDELAERDRLNELVLLVVDHQPGREVLPTPDGGLRAVEALAPPLRARSLRGRDVRAELRDADGRGYRGHVEDFAPGDGEPREVIELSFRRPAAAGAALVLRARNTRFAELAFVRYLSRMGSGVTGLLRLAERSRSYPYATRLRDEMRRLGFLLRLERVDGAGRVSEVAELRPIGPATLRSVAIPLPLPPGDGEVRVRVSLAPLLWELDQVALAQASAAPPPLELRPTHARARGGEDVREALLSTDEARVTLDTGESVEARFAAPPLAPGLARTVLVRITGFYEFDVESHGLLDLFAVLRHRRGADSLPRFALRLAREEPALTQE